MGRINSDEAPLNAVLTTGPKNPLSLDNVWNIVNSSIKRLNNIFEYVRFNNSNLLLNS